MQIDIRSTLNNIFSNTTSEQKVMLNNWCRTKYGQPLQIWTRRNIDEDDVKVFIVELDEALKSGDWSYFEPSRFSSDPASLSAETEEPEEETEADAPEEETEATPDEPVQHEEPEQEPEEEDPTPIKMVIPKENVQTEVNSEAETAIKPLVQYLLSQVPQQQQPDLEAMIERIVDEKITAKFKKLFS